jgi:hypothetical protein
MLLVNGLLHALLCWLGTLYPARFSPRVRELLGRTFKKSPYLRTGLALCVWSYNSVVGAVVQFFSCRQVPHNMCLGGCAFSHCRATGWRDGKTDWQRVGVA